MSADLIADSAVSAFAIAGLLVLRGMLGSSGGEVPVNSRFLFGIDVVTVMLAARLLFWLTGAAVFETILVAAAGMIPLAALILCEGLLRRHAPRFLKWIAAGGAIVFIVLALFNAQTVGPVRSVSLLTFQSFIFLSVGYLVITRDRDSLSLAENRTVERLGLSLLLILPLAITDFSQIVDTHVRLAGIAVLFLCWLAVSLRRSGVDHRQVYVSFATLLASALVAGLAISWLADFDTPTTVQAVAIVICATVLASLANESRIIRRGEERSGLLRFVASSEDDAQAFLNGLEHHPAIADAVVLRDGDLSDFDETFRVALSQRPVRTVSELASGEKAEGDEQLRWFFERYGATHVLLAADDPFTVIAFNIPALAQSPVTDMDLKIVQRMARLLSKNPATA